jgi:hypothetical protein
MLPLQLSNSLLSAVGRSVVDILRPCKPNEVTQAKNTTETQSEDLAVEAEQVQTAPPRGEGEPQLQGKACSWEAAFAYVLKISGRNSPADEALQGCGGYARAMDGAT